MNDATKLKAFYSKYDETRGDNRSDLLDLFAEELQFGSAADEYSPSDHAAMKTAKTAVLAQLDGLFAAWSMNHFTVTNVIENGDKVVVLADVSFSNRTTGKILNTRKADFVRFENGHIVEFFEYFDTHAFHDAMT